MGETEVKDMLRLAQQKDKSRSEAETPTVASGLKVEAKMLGKRQK